MIDTPTTPTEVADFLERHDAPGTGSDAAVNGRKRTRLLLGHDAGDEMWQLGRVEHLNRILDAVVADRLAPMGSAA